MDIICPQKDGASPDLNVTLLMPKLSVLQWQVVEIALRDAGAAGAWWTSTAFWARLLLRFGIRIDWHKNKRLANKGLETLRQFVCLCRQGDQEACTLVPELEATGFDKANIMAIACFAQLRMRQGRK
jgi:hypothetical protein